MIIFYAHADEFEYKRNLHAHTMDWIYIFTDLVLLARVDVPTDEEALDDLGRNANLLYIFHQDDPDSQQANDVRSERQPQSQQGSDVLYIIFNRLVLATTIDESNVPFYSM